jgi:hypothetical protein
MLGEKNLVLGEGKFVKQKKVPFFIQGEAKI